MLDVDPNVMKDFVQGLGLDFTDDDPGKDDSELEKLSKLASRQERAEETVKKLTLELAKAEAGLAEISERKIPELMARLGLDTIKTKEGLTVEVKSTLRASIAQEDLAKQEQAFTWLEERGHDRLIKREIKIQFGKSDTAWANKFEADLRKRKRPLVWDRKMTVHAKTLAAFLSSELEKGTDVPMTIFNAFHQKCAKIKRAK